MRKPRTDDVPFIFSYAANPLASRFMGWSTHRDMEESHAYIKSCIEDWRGEETLSWVIECDDAVVGMIAARLKGRNAGVGYALAPTAWGRGYATEALDVISDALFRHSPVSAIWALCVVENPASARVLEKCGYQREKLIPNYFPCPNLDGEKHDVWRYVRYRPPSV